MLSPNQKQKIQSPRGQNSKVSAQEGSSLSPYKHRHLASFKPRNLSDLKGDSPSSKRSNSPFEKPERSFSTLYSKYMQKRTYEEHHQLGYSADQIKKAVHFIFQKYDSNHDNVLDQTEVKRLIQHSLLHMGQKHTPSQREIMDFIFLLDKNSDGKLSREELENAFKRANRVEY